MVNHITRTDLQTKIGDGGVILLEALPAAYYDDGHLPGALNLSLDAVDTTAAHLIPSDSTATIVTYCSGPSCPNSRIAAERLAQLGYHDVYAYEGGKEDWTNAGLPLQRSAASASS